MATLRAGGRKGGDASGARKVNAELFTLDEKTLEGRMKDLASTTSSSVRRARMISRNKDTIHTLLDSLNTKPKFTKMVEYSLECLKNLAVDEVSIEEMIDEGTLDVLLNIMKLNPYNEKIQQMVNKTLQAFAINERLANVIAERMGSAGFVFSMKKHVEPETLASTCQAVSKLMRSDGAVGMFVKGGTIPALRHVVHTSEQHAEVLLAASACFDRIADSKQYCGELMECGAVTDLLAAMKNYPENAMLVAHVTSLIAKLASADPKNIEAIKAMGAVDILVAALDMHPDDERLNAVGARALRLLAGQSDVSQALKGASGISIETANALAKMASLLLVDENVDFLVANEGVKWLIAALNQALPEHSEVASKILVSGSRALMRLATDENKIYSIMQAGGVPLLIAVIDGHIKDENVVVSAMSALARMITRKENAAYIVKSGGVKSAIAALQSHPQSERVAKAALEMYMKLAAHEDSVQPLIDAGVLQSIVATLQQHGAKHPILAGMAVTTLGRLAISQDILGKMAQAGAIKELVSLLATHKNDLELAKQITLLVESIALAPENIDALRTHGAMDAILSAMEAHAGDADLQAIGSRTLAMIAGEAQLKQSVEYVAQLSEGYIKAPGTLATIIDKLLGASKLVSNFALIDGNLAALQRNGAVKALIGAFNAAARMPVSEKRTALLAAGAAGLLNMSKDAQSAGLIVTLGGVRELLAQSLKEIDHDELAQYVTALTALTAANPQNAGQMIKDNTIEALIGVTRAHQVNEQVLAATVKALSLMATTSELARRICLAGGGEIACDSIRANLLDKELLLDGLRLLNQMCVDDECIAKLLAAGAIDALIDAMRAHPNDPEVQAACMQTLCRLLVNEDVAKVVGEKGGCGLAVKAMRTHYALEGLCEVDMILLDSLASIAENVGRLNEPELATVELVKWIGNTYGHNALLNEAMRRLVESLLAPQYEAAAAAHAAANPQVAPVHGGEAFDPAQCDVVLTKFKAQSTDKADALRMLRAMNAALQEPANAHLMLSKNGLQALADLMDKYKDDEDLFYQASSAFLALTDAGGDKVVEMLESPAMLKALCAMMNAHEVYATPMNLADLTKAIGATAKLKMKAPTVTELLKNRPLESLMNILNLSDDPVLLTQAARLLYKISNNSDAALLLSKLANLRELIQAIRRNMKHEDFLKYAVYLLGNLALNDELKSQIGIEGGIQAILSIMDAYPLSEALIENCCYALSELSFGNDINVNFIVGGKGVPLILNAMHNHPRAHEGLLLHAVNILCNLCQNQNNNNKDAILKLGGAQAIVDTVLNNFQALDFLQASFRAIGNLAYSAASVSTVIKAGGVQGLVAGMTVHNTDMEIIDIAIRVLSLLASDASAESMAIMAQEGAVQAIVEAAANYTDKLDIEIEALKCLANLGRHGSNAAMIIKQGGTEATIQAMTALDFDANLMAAAFLLIKTLARTPPSELEKMHEAGITPALVSGLKKQATNKVVLSAAMTTFSLLAYNTDNAERMGTQGVLQVILKIVQDNLTNQQVLVECFPALSALARSEGNAVSMSELAMSSLSSCITNPQATPVFLAVCFNFLANLCVHKQATEGILRTGLVTATLNVLHRSLGLPDILLRGLKALENMCYSTDEVKSHLRLHGLEAGVHKITSDNIALDDVRIACKAVIDALNWAKQDITIPDMKQIDYVDNLKKAREIFDDKKKSKEVVKELPESVRNFLTAGAMLVKHSNTAAPRTRHVYVTSDLKFLVWKDPRKPLHPDNKMKISMIRTCETGRCTPQLERKSFGKFLAKEECAFAVMGRQRTVDLEAASERERQIWIDAIEMLIAYKKEVKRQMTQFA